MRCHASPIPIKIFKGVVVTAREMKIYNWILHNYILATFIIISTVPRDAIQKIEFKLLRHTPDSPDLVLVIALVLNHTSNLFFWSTKKWPILFDMQEENLLKAKAGSVLLETVQFACELFSEIRWKTVKSIQQNLLVLMILRI